MPVSFLQRWPLASRAWPAVALAAAALVGAGPSGSTERPGETSERHGIEPRPRAVDAAVEPPRVERVQRDLSYGDHDRQRFDLHLPPASAGTCPIVIFFHGGAFVGGDKGQLPPRVVAEFIASGVAVASANYRFVTTDPLPAAMHDAARVVQTLRAGAERFGLDPQRFAVAGSSAGGGLALWVALHEDLADPGAEDPVALASSRVSAAWVQGAQVSYDPRDWVAYGLGRVVAMQPFPLLYGFGPHTPHDDPALAAVAEESAPIRHLSAGDPPLRLDYGASPQVNADTQANALLHHPNHGLALQRAAEPLGVACEVHHGGTVRPTRSGVDFLLRELGVR